VYPVERVFLGEIPGKDDQLYALDATKYFARVAENTHSRDTAPPGVAHDAIRGYEKSALMNPARPHG